MMMKDSYALKRGVGATSRDVLRLALTVKVNHFSIRAKLLQGVLERVDGTGDTVETRWRNH